MNDDLGDEKISALYRQLPDTQPSAATDALIRAAARRAVNAGPRKTIFTAPLQRLLATAATLVLGIALVVQWQHEPARLQDALATAPHASLPTAAPEMLPADIAAAPATAAPAQRTGKKYSFADIAAKKENPAQDIAAEPNAKAAQESPQKTVPEPVLYGGAAGMLSAQAAPAPAPALRPEAKTEAEASHDQAEEYLADRADNAAKAKAGGNSLRLKREAAAAIPAATAAITTEAEAEAPLKQAITSGRAAKERKADSPAVPLPPYQQAMQAGNWALAQKIMPAPAQNNSAFLQMDRDLLAQLQGSRQRPGCAALFANIVGPESLLCDFLILHAEGRTLPATMMQQLEAAGFLGGAMEYRRKALSDLGKY